MAERSATAEIGRVERLIAMRSFPGWADLPASTLAAVSAAARPRLLAEGERLFDEHDVVSSVLLVVEGALVTRRGGRVLRTIGPRDWMGAVLGFAQGPLGLECVAARESAVLEIDVEDLEDLFEDRVEVLARALAALCRETIALRGELDGDAGFPPPTGEPERAPQRALDVVERVFYLRRTSALRRGRIDAMAAVAETGRELRAAAGEHLWRAGDPSGSMLAIVAGAVSATTERGQRFTFGAGDLVGSLDTFAGVPRWFDATASAPLVALALDRDEMLDVWEDHPDLGIALLRSVSGSLIGLLDAAGLGR